MSFNCGNFDAIPDSCKNIAANAVWGREGPFKRLVQETVDIGTLGIKIVVGFMGASLSPNLLKALNAIRCMLNSFGNNTWNLLAAVWWAAK